MATVQPGQAQTAKGASFIAWMTVALFFFMALLSYLDRQIIALVVDPIKDTFQVNDFEIGLLQGAAFGLFYAVFGLPMGWMVDRYPRRLVVYGGVTVWSLATAACGLAGTFGQLAVSRFFVGIGEATLSPAAYSMLADRFPRHKLAFALSVFGLGTALGSVVALAVGGPLIAYFEAHPPIVLPGFGALRPWQTIFLVVGLPGVLFAFLMLLVPEPRRVVVKRDKVDSGALKAFMRRHWRYYACHFIGFGFIRAIAYSSSAWSVVLITRRYGLSLAEAGPLLATALLCANIPGFLLGGWLVDRWFRSGRTDAHFRYFAYSMVGVGLVGALSSQFAPSAPVFLVGLAATGFFLPFTGPAGSHLQLVTPPEFRGRISAMFGLSFTLIGMCFGPPIVGLLTVSVFHDPMRVNSSLAILYLVAGSGAALFLSLGLGPARRGIAEYDERMAAAG